MAINVLSSFLCVISIIIQQSVSQLVGPTALAISARNPDQSSGDGSGSSQAPSSLKLTGNNNHPISVIGDDDRSPAIFLPNVSFNSPSPSPNISPPPNTLEPVEQNSLSPPSNTPLDPIGINSSPTTPYYDGNYGNEPYDTSLFYDQDQYNVQQDQNNNIAQYQKSIFQQHYDYIGQNQQQYQQEDVFNQSNGGDSPQNYDQPFIRNIMYGDNLGAILPRQVTPSKDNTQSCLSYWSAPPKEFNGMQLTHCFPLSAVGRLQIFYKDVPTPATCTGSLIGPNTVLTAGHCFLFDTVNVEFTPGQFGDYKPFGNFSGGVVVKPDGFSLVNITAMDYAIVKFDKNIGDLTGWLGVEYQGCGNLGYNLTVAGFAEDIQSDQMFTAGCNDTFIDVCAKGDASGMFRHECDTFGGTSGAPLIMENNMIVGVHSGYVGSVDKNAASYMSRQLMDFIYTNTQ